MADISAFGFDSDVDFCRHLVHRARRGDRPRSSFFHDKALGRQLIRFCFCKKDETLDRAVKRLKGLRVIV